MLSLPPRTRHGFTLMELLIVVVTVAILGTIGVPTYRSFVIRARQQEAIVNVGSTRAGITGYILEGLPTFGTVDLCSGADPTVARALGVDFACQGNYTYSARYLSGLDFDVDAAERFDLATNFRGVFRSCPVCTYNGVDCTVMWDSWRLSFGLGITHTVDPTSFSDCSSEPTN